VQYFSLGTFEFLINPTTEEYYFLEVNPRLQVEHTITESISMTDIVKAQLLLAQGSSLADCGLLDTQRDPRIPPQAHSIQLRITAENVQSDWSLSIGKITSFQFPAGNGIRVDTNLNSGHLSAVSADFDSLMAKLIVTASTWKDAVKKAQRALVSGFCTKCVCETLLISYLHHCRRIHRFLVSRPTSAYFAELLHIQTFWKVIATPNGLKESKQNSST
jgi:pyruvate carboxylase